MADIQLMHFRQRRNRQHVVVGQTVTGIDLQSQAGGKGRGVTDTRQLSVTRQSLWCFGVSAGMDFDVRRAAVRPLQSDGDRHR